MRSPVASYLWLEASGSVRVLMCTETQRAHPHSPEPLCEVTQHTEGGTAAKKSGKLTQNEPEWPLVTLLFNKNGNM